MPARTTWAHKAACLKHEAAASRVHNTSLSLSLSHSQSQSLSLALPFSLSLSPLSPALTLSLSLLLTHTHTHTHTLTHTCTRAHTLFSGAELAQETGSDTEPLTHTHTHTHTHTERDPSAYGCFTKTTLAYFLLPFPSKPLMAIKPWKEGGRERGVKETEREICSLFLHEYALSLCP